MVKNESESEKNKKDGEKKQREGERVGIWPSSEGPAISSEQHWDSAEHRDRKDGREGKDWVQQMKNVFSLLAGYQAPACDSPT